MFHTRKIKVFEYHLTLLKQDLKATSEKLRYKNKPLRGKRINYEFNRNQKSVYRLFRGNNTTIRDLPNQNDVETFWGKIRGESKELNYNAPWLSQLEKTYCTKVKPHDYTIDDKTISNVVKRL